MAPPPSCRLFVLLMTALFALFTVALSHGDDEGGPTYSYKSGSPDGPEMWGKLSPKYKLCGDGLKQSPIDIITRNAIPTPNLDNLTRVYAPTPSILNKNSNDIVMTFDDGKYVGDITVNYNGAPKKLDLRKIHWHSPSEHTINGEHFPLELHLVHASPDGDIAVIGILYKIGDPDPLYYQLQESLVKLKTSPKVFAGVVDLKSLQKRTGSYFRYMGSLTTPPCTENVIWNILGKVREISMSQLLYLTSPLPAKDSRPPQPLNGRPIYFYNPLNSKVSFKTI